MSEAYYREALKRGQKDARARASRGQSPCLPVLDDFILPERSAAGISLGIVQIPTEFLVGARY